MSPRRQRNYALVGAAILVGGLAVTWLLRPREPAPASPNVTVFAAASLRDVMYEIGSAFSLEHSPEQRVHFNIAGSNVLAQQILAASQADVFVSANERWMDHVEKAGRIVPGSRKAILANRLVVVAHRSSDWTVGSPQDLARLPFRYLSLANPEAVPAGQYAKAFLESVTYDHAPVWDAVAGRVAPAADVRAALALVESDPSVAGIVYRTDATASGQVRILYEIPADRVPPVRYSAARIYRPGAPAGAEQFYEFLFSDTAQAIFAEHGFAPVLAGGASG